MTPSVDERRPAHRGSSCRRRWCLAFAMHDCRPHSCRRRTAPREAVRLLAEGALVGVVERRRDAGPSGWAERRCTGPCRPDTWRSSRSRKRLSPWRACRSDRRFEAGIADLLDRQRCRGLLVHQQHDRLGGTGIADVGDVAGEIDLADVEIADVADRRSTSAAPRACRLTPPRPGVVVPGDEGRAASSGCGQRRYSASALVSWSLFGIDAEEKRIARARSGWGAVGDRDDQRHAEVRRRSAPRRAATRAAQLAQHRPASRSIVASRCIAEAPLGGIGQQCRGP